MIERAVNAQTAAAPATAAAAAAVAVTPPKNLRNVSGRATVGT